jgi:hypothetical protein
MVNARRARVVPLALPVLFLPLAACSDDDDTAVPVATTSVAPAVTAVPMSGSFVEIRVNADDPAAHGEVERVALGQMVVLALLSDTDREYHVHGYDLVARAAAGAEQVFEFTADKSGRFDVEDHVTGDVLRVLEVG